MNRAKNGEPSTHPLSGVELRALRRLKRESIKLPLAGHEHKRKATGRCEGNKRWLRHVPMWSR